MDFRDFYDLAAKVKEYEELLREESQRRKTSMGTYCQEVNYEEIAVTDLLTTGSFISPLLMKTAFHLWKKSSNTQVQSMFDVQRLSQGEIHCISLRSPTPHQRRT